MMVISLGHLQLLVRLPIIWVELWCHKFDSVGDIDQDSVDTLSQYLPAVVWPDLPVPTRDEYMQLLQQQSWSAPGPDGLSFRSPNNQGRSVPREEPGKSGFRGVV